MQVIFLGPQGTYSHEAVRYFVGQTACQLIPQDTIHDVVAYAANQWRMGHPNIAIVPVSNSFLGIVEETLSCLASSTLFGQAGHVVIGEVPLPIQHSLLVKPDASGQTPPLSSIKEVHSHPQALGQCAQYLEANLPQAQVIPSKSTGAAIPHVLQSSTGDVAAIASSISAELYGLTVGARSIQTMKGMYDDIDADNITRFYVITVDPDHKDVAQFLDECRTVNQTRSNVCRSLMRVRMPSADKVDLRAVADTLRSSTKGAWTVAKDVHTSTTSAEESLLFEVERQDLSCVPDPSNAPTSLLQTLYAWPASSSMECLGIWTVPEPAK